MIRHRIRLVLALLAVLAVALVPASKLEGQAGKGTIKIATQSPLSGGQAALGEGIKLGAGQVHRPSLPHHDQAEQLRLTMRSNKASGFCVL